MLSLLDVVLQIESPSTDLDCLLLSQLKGQKGPLGPKTVTHGGNEPFSRRGLGHCDGPNGFQRHRASLCMNSSKWQVGPSVACSRPVPTSSGLPPSPTDAQSAAFNPRAPVKKGPRCRLALIVVIRMSLTGGGTSRRDALASQPGLLRVTLDPGFFFRAIDSLCLTVVDLERSCW